MQCCKHQRQRQFFFFFFFFESSAQKNSYNNNELITVISSGYLVTWVRFDYQELQRTEITFIFLSFICPFLPFFFKMMADNTLLLLFLLLLFFLPSIPKENNVKPILQAAAAARKSCPFTCTKGKQQQFFVLFSFPQWQQQQQHQVWLAAHKISGSSLTTVHLPFGLSFTVCKMKQKRKKAAAAAAALLCLWCVFHMLIHTQASHETHAWCRALKVAD